MNNIVRNKNTKTSGRMDGIVLVPVNDGDIEIKCGQLEDIEAFDVVETGDIIVVKRQTKIINQLTVDVYDGNGILKEEFYFFQDKMCRQFHPEWDRVSMKELAKTAINILNN